MNPSRALDQTDGGALDAGMPARHGVSAALLSVMMALLSYGVRLRGGMYSLEAFCWIAGAFGLCMISLYWFDWLGARRLSRVGLPLIVGISVTMNVILQVIFPPASYMDITKFSDFTPFLTLFIAFGATVIVATTETPWLLSRHKWLVLIAFLLTGIWMLVHTPHPAIDTFYVHQESSQALLEGRNPYAITVPNIYGPDTPYYPREFMSGDRMLFGYTYPPLSLLASLPGYALFGDHRVSMLVCLLAAGWLMASLTRGPLALFALATFLTFSRIYQVLESSWTEPLLVLLLAGTVFSALRGYRATPILFGLLLASKQHMLLFAPAGLLLLPQPWQFKQILNFFGKAAITGLVVTLPFILWDPHAFYNSVVAVHLALPPRWDSLSVTSLFHEMQWLAPPEITTLVLVALVYVIAWLRAPRTPAGFALTVTAAAFAFFVFGKGFLNYYFFVYGAACCTLAAMGEIPSPAPKLSSPG